MDRRVTVELLLPFRFCDACREGVIGGHVEGNEEALGGFDPSSNRTQDRT